MPHLRHVFHREEQREDRVEERYLRNVCDNGATIGYLLYRNVWGEPSESTTKSLWCHMTTTFLPTTRWNNCARTHQCWKKSDMATACAAGLVSRRVACACL